MNLLAGEIVRTNGTGRFRGAGFELALPDGLKSAQAGAATLGIRPEHVGVGLGGIGDIGLPVRLGERLGGGTRLYFGAGTARGCGGGSEGLAMAKGWGGGV